MKIEKKTHDEVPKRLASALKIKYFFLLKQVEKRAFNAN